MRKCMYQDIYGIDVAAFSAAVNDVFSDLIDSRRYGVTVCPSLQLSGIKAKHETFAFVLDCREPFCLRC